jgi:hypothetical protein
MDFEIDTLIQVIASQTGLSREEIMKKIDETAKRFNGLLTDYGAAHIVGYELGILDLQSKIRLFRDSVYQKFSNLRKIETEPIIETNEDDPESEI